MNAKEIENQLTVTYQKTLETLENIPSNVDIWFTTSDYIQLTPKTYAENMQSIHAIRKNTNLDLASYDMNGNDLHLRYESPGFDVICACTDAENALKRASGGKCTLKVEALTTTETSTVVVCELDKLIMNHQ